MLIKRCEHCGILETTKHSTTVWALVAIADEDEEYDLCPDCKVDLISFLTKYVTSSSKQSGA